MKLILPNFYRTHLPECLIIEPGLMEGLLSADEGVPEVVVKPAIVLRVDQALGCEVSDLTSELCGVSACVKAINQVNSTLSIQQGVIERVYVVSKDGAHACAGDDDPLGGISLPFGGSNCRSSPGPKSQDRLRDACTGTKSSYPTKREASTAPEIPNHRNLLRSPGDAWPFFCTTGLPASALRNPVCCAEIEHAMACTTKSRQD